MTMEIQEMTKEEIDAYVTMHDLKAKAAGFVNTEEMDTFKVDASLGMIKFGGGFTHFLGHALARADGSNTVRLVRAFREICNEHAELYKKWLANRFREGIKDEEEVNDGTEIERPA